MSTAMLAAIQTGLLRPALFVECQFVSGSVYMWTGIGPITWNSQTWIGVGNFGGISVIEEGVTVEAKGITLSLSGIDSGMLADALQEVQVGLPVSVFLGLFDGSGSLIADPLTTWSGRVDQPSLDVGGSTAGISINCESRLIDMNVAVDRRYTLDDQQIDQPGDLGFQFVNSIQEMTVYFGQTPLSSNNL